MRSKFHSNPLSDNTNPSTTKRGPGRFHKDGHKKNSPVASKGAPRGFVVHTNPEKNTRRMDKKIFGARQLRKQDAAFREQAAMLRQTSA